MVPMTLLNGCLQEIFSSLSILPGTIWSHAPKVECSSLIWFKGAVPKHSFLSWLAFLDRLPPKMRIAKYMDIDTSCVLCGLPAQVWEVVFTTVWKPGPIPSVWDQFLLWATHALKQNTDLNLVIKLGVVACIYHCYIERNNRLHGKPPSDELVLSQLILHDVRGTILGLPMLRMRCSEFDLQPRASCPFQIVLGYYESPRILCSRIGG